MNPLAEGELFLWKAFALFEETKGAGKQTDLETLPARDLCLRRETLVTEIGKTPWARLRSK